MLHSVQLRSVDGQSEQKSQMRIFNGPPLTTNVIDSLNSLLAYFLNSLLVYLIGGYDKLSKLTIELDEAYGQLQYRLSYTARIEAFII